jgi:ATP-binding cassette, subfamily B, bacterial
VSRRHRGSPPDPPSPRAGALARTLLGAGARCWRAGRAQVAVQAAAALLTGLAPVATAWLLRAILDELAAGHPRHLVELALLLGITGAVAALLPSAERYAQAQLTRAITRTGTADLFASVTEIRGLRRLEDPAFQDRLRVAGQVGAPAPGQVVSGGIAVLQSAITLAGFLGTLAVLSPPMAAVVLVAAVPAVYLQRGIARRQADLFSDISHGQRRQFFYAGLLTSLAAAKEIRLLGLGGFFRARLLGELTATQQASQQVDRRVLASESGLAAIGGLVAAAGLVWAAWQAAAGRLTVGDVSVFVVALGSVSQAVEGLIISAAMTYQALLMFQGYTDVLACESDLPVRVAAVKPGPLRYGIEIDDVWFRYGPDEPWVLRGLSCFIPHGQAVAIVGKNGGGKSTLVKLLCRFYDPDRGSIRWDGVDLRDLDLDALRDRISVVFQDYMTYELSAAENIAVGDLGLADQPDALAAAAEQADIHATLAALPRGYQTLLTRTFFDLTDREDPRTGVLLSGGQWQRVALARAFLRGGRDLMILDEPSSGLDPEAERMIHTTLAATRAGRASVLISHRLNAVRDAGHILVLSDGAVREQGDHDTLMARGGLYARLFTMQAQGYSAVPATVAAAHG